MKEVFGNRVSVKDERRNKENPNIVKSTFNLYSSKGIEKVEAVFDLQSRQLIGQNFLDMGFFYAKKGDQTVEAVDQFLRGKLARYSLGKATILKAEKREVNEQGEVRLYYEFENETVLAKVAFSENNFTILHLESLDSQLQELREANLEQQEQERVAVRKDPEFENLEAVLFELYGQYLSGAELIGAETSEISGRRIYKAFYSNDKGTFKAVLLYDYGDESGRIVSFTIPRSSEIPATILNCGLVNEKKQCVSCLEGFYLAADKLCYEKMEACVVQSGRVCIECEVSFSMT